jgi:putative copper resistance protein D
LPTWLAAARAVHYGACASLFGLALFQLYALQAPPWRVWRIALAAVALISGAAWFALVTLSLAGDLTADAVTAMVRETSFGSVWLVRLGLAVAAILLAAMANRPARMASCLVCALLLASIALTGHTQTHEGGVRAFHVGSDAVHLLGAGGWIGGLLGLCLALPGPNDDAKAASVARFSRMAYGAVAAIVGSGLINAVILVASPMALVTTGYGRLLLAKLALFAAMLGFAAYNRLVLSPALSGPHADAAARRLRRNALGEQLLAAGILICVAFLGMGQPPA